TVDLQDLMEVTDEDLELLEMTERTLVAQTSEDEETIMLKTGKEGEEEEEETAPPTEEEPAATAAEEPGPADLELEAEDIELELIEEEPADTAAEAEDTDDLFGGADPSAYVWEAPHPEAAELAPDESGLEGERPATKKKPAKKTPKKAAKKKKAAKQAAAPKEAPPKKAAPKKEPAEPAAPEAGSKKPVTLILVSLLVLLVLGIGGGVAYFLFLQPSTSRVAMTAPGQADRPVTAPAPAPEPRPAASAPAEPPETAQSVPPTSPPTVSEERTAAPEPPAPAAPKAAASTPPPETDVYTLHGIDFQQAAGELRMKIRTDDATGEYSFFPLSDPPRLVIDLFGSWNETPFQEKSVATGPIRRLRLGEHDDKLRIVADMRSDHDMTPEFTRVSDGIVMTLSTR
ncbi:MAG: AMIN domain-containing protein, partial [Desulfosudaceae bacterium]